MALTLEELKDKLSTYGVNDGERNAPVVVTLNGTPTPIVAVEVDWDFTDGTSVVLSIEENA